MMIVACVVPATASATDCHAIQPHAIEVMRLARAIDPLTSLQLRFVRTEIFHALMRRTSLLLPACDILFNRSGGNGGAETLVVAFNCHYFISVQLLAMCRQKSSGAGRGLMPAGFRRGVYRWATL